MLKRNQSIPWEGEFDEPKPRINNPHRNLLAAVLERAILDLQPDMIHKVLHPEVDTWRHYDWVQALRTSLLFFSSTEKHKDFRFTFLQICEELDLEPNAILNAIGFKEKYEKYWPVVQAAIKRFHRIDVVCPVVKTVKGQLGVPLNIPKN